MPNRPQSRSRSSNGRGGNTQQEQKTLWKMTAKKQKMSKGELDVKVEGKEDSGGKLNGEDVERRAFSIRSTQCIDEVVAEIFCKSEPELWESQLLEIIQQYDDHANRMQIHVYGKAVTRLKQRLESNDETASTRRILGWTLKSYQRRLDEAQGIFTSTPSSSEDEDAIEFFENHRDFSKPTEEENEEELHMGWCNWPYTEVEGRPEGKPAHISGKRCTVAFFQFSLSLCSQSF